MKHTYEYILLSVGECNLTIETLLEFRFSTEVISVFFLDNRLLSFELERELIKNEQLMSMKRTKESEREGKRTNEACNYQLTAETSVTHIKSKHFCTHVYHIIYFHFLNI